MISYRGFHSSFEDFPVIKGKLNKYRDYTNKDLRLNFGEIIYQLPEMVMHYLDDEEAIGWSWLPPQNFIDRIMKGGAIRFEISDIENLILETETIGYLRPKEGKIVDTKGGDANFENAMPVLLGKAPEVFIERMKKILDAARSFKPTDADSKNSRESQIIFPPAKSYESVVIPKVPLRKLSYQQRFSMLERLKKKDWSKELLEELYTISKMAFFALDDQTAIINTELWSENIYDYGRYQIRKILHELPKVFAELGVQFDADTKSPWIKISGIHLKKLKELGATIINMDDKPSLEQKLSMVFGCHVYDSDISTKVSRAEACSSIKNLLGTAKEVDINLLENPPLRDQVSKLISGDVVDRVILDKNGKVYCEGKIHVVEMAMPVSHEAGLGRFLRPIYRIELEDDEDGNERFDFLYGSSIRHESGAKVRYIHYPNVKDRAGPLDKEFLTVLDKAFEKCLINQYRKEYIQKNKERVVDMADSKAVDKTVTHEQRLFSKSKNSISESTSESSDNLSVVENASPPGGLSFSD